MRVRHTYGTTHRNPWRIRAAALITAAASTVAVGVGPTSAAEAQHRGHEVQLRVGSNPAETVLVTAERPVGVLRQADVERTHHDRVVLVRHGRTIQADRNKQVREGDVVKLVRIGRDVTVNRHAIKRGTVTRKTTAIAPGKRKVVALGHAGVRTTRVVRWTRNGHHFHTDVTRHVTRAPAPRRVLVGVKARTVPGTAHLNWRGLANCESGGNPRAVNSAGYYGLYQFSVSTWHSVGGRGMPNQASPSEQTYRAQRLYAQRGRSPWPYCGRFL